MTALTPRQGAELVLGLGVAWIVWSAWDAWEAGSWDRAAIVRLSIGAVMLIAGGIWRSRVIGRGL